MSHLLHRTQIKIQHVLPHQVPDWLKFGGYRSLPAPVRRGFWARVWDAIRSVTK